MARHKRRFKIRGLGSGISRRIVLGWIFSLFIPFIVIFAIGFINYGDAIISVIKGDTSIFQIKGYSGIEQVERDINIWTLDNPKFQDHDDVNEKILEIVPRTSPIKGFILERKGDRVEFFTPVNEDVAEELKIDFEGVTNLSLPEFGQRDLPSNELLFEQTGYTIYNQIDFYYADGEEGSVFFLVKFTGVPSAIFNFIVNNLTRLILLMMLAHLFLSLFFAHRVTKPIENILDVMKRYQKQDFKPRLNEKTKEPMIRTINTAINEMAEELDRRKIQDEIVEEQRVEFIAKISHDTKTPLASIKAHAEAFRDGMIQDNEKRMKYTNNILSKVDIIDNMINELSLYSELANGMEEYQFQKIDLNYYLIDILEELQYDYPKESLRIHYEPCKDKKLMTDIDVTRFNRVLMNIVKNSVRYSDREMTIIDVTVETVDDQLTLYIKDNGNGMDSSKTDFIFKSFTRGDASRDPNKGGSGLGLAIAKTIIEGHNGTIKANTKKNEYFEIVIKLPMEGSE